MPDIFDLDRFVEAQDPIIRQVCLELAEGRKQIHWMWFMFPQLRGLGRSPTAEHFGLKSLREADAYFHHPVLGPRLIDCTGLMLDINGKTARDVLGSPDDLKFHSSMTLFATVPETSTVFAEALVKYFGGKPDPLTVKLLEIPS